MPSNQYNSSYTGTNHDTYVTKEQLIDLVYPVGSYYISENSTNPTALFGGSWEQIKDRFILAAGDSYTGGAIGGSSNHSHTTNTGTSGGPSNNTSGGTAITIAQMPSHDHYTTSTRGLYLMNEPTNRVYAQSGGTTGQGGGYTTWQWAYGVNPQGGGGSHTHTLSSHTHSQTSVGTSSVSNMPPYLVAYIWKRIA